MNGVKTATRTREINLSRKVIKCPKCNAIAKRHSTRTRSLREVSGIAPTRLRVTYSNHFCPACRKHFSLSMDHIAKPGARFTHRVQRTALDMVLKQGLTLEATALRMRTQHNVLVPPTTLHDWVVAETGQ